MKISPTIDHSITGATNSDEPVEKKPKIETLVLNNDSRDEDGEQLGHTSESTSNNTCMCKYKQTLLVSDIEALCNGDKLNDKHINFAQALLKAQFPSVEGLSCTLYQSKPRASSEKIRSGLQIVHCRNDHWILVSNISSPNLLVYDSVYNDIDKATMTTLNNLFIFRSVKVVKFQKQIGGKDCGVFSIAAATQLLLKGDTSHLKQDTMRSHVLKCFEQGFFSSFT